MIWLSIRGIAIVTVTLKALLMTGVVTLLGTTFIQSLILVLVSGSVTGAAVIFAAILTTRAMRSDREVLHDIKRKVGATKREGDELPAENQP